jgi:CheY-like chemotaxis protein
MLRRVIGEDIELETRTGPNLALIRADPSQIEQVILNLVVNARDAMPGGGKLTIETANARIGHEFPRGLPDSLPGDYVMLAVSDSGCGIDPQMKPHIFEPFFTTKEVGKGTGLGLSTVYGIVTQGGGHIRVESAPGEGSRFRVYFPQVAGSPAPSAAPQRLVARGGSETILLVEDEPAVRRMAKEILARLGYKLVEASDPRSAQKLIAEYDQPIHLLLTDVVMPQMSGRELARQVTELRAGMKVMFMSGYAHESILQEGLLQPGSIFLRKPFTPDALAVKVREALEGAP